MNILIDAYNLLKQIVGKKEVSQQERDRLYEQALVYARKKGHALHLVYDGGPYNRPTRVKSGSVVIMFSGYNETADDVIKHFIEERLLKDVLLVTTDRQLNRFAGQHDIPSIDSLDFFVFMKESSTQESSQPQKKEVGQAQKLRPEDETPELDHLMEEASRALPARKEEEGTVPTYKRGASKQEKRLITLLKKL